MRATIRRDNIKIEFSGRGQIWNDLLRPYFGGPEAPPEAERPVATVTPVPAAQAPLPPAPPVRPAATFEPAAPRPAIAVQPAPVGQAARPAAPAQPRTWYPPRTEAPRRFEPGGHGPGRPELERNAPPQHYSAEEEEHDSVQVEPSSDPATLYARLAAIPGRRSERDAVLAAVWFLTKGEQETTSDDVEAHFQLLHVFPDVKVTPHLLKHIHRTKMLEQGSTAKAVRLSKKGAGSVRGRLVPV
jgi:hypothetical protein